MFGLVFIVGSLGWTDINEIWGDHRPIIDVPRICLDMRRVAVSKSERLKGE